MIKLLFAGHDLKFAQFLIDHYTNKDGYEVKIDKWQGHNIHDEQKSIEFLEWADIIFCEWGLGNAVWYSNNKKSHQKLIVRMHLQERETEYPKKFNYENIDYIVAISPYIYEEMYRHFDIPRYKMKMIYNSVDTEKFKANSKKDNMYNIGIVGIIPKRKRIDRALDILEKLNSSNNNYKLFVKGNLPSEVAWIKNNEEENSYYNKVFDRIKNSDLKDKVIFDGHGNDMDEWLSKIGIILSTSDFESFHLAPMEGMSTGAYPIIFNWDGADTVYKNEWIVDSVDAAVKKIENVLVNGYSEKNMREYVVENYDKKIILKEYEELI